MFILNFFVSCGTKSILCIVTKTAGYATVQWSIP